MGYLVANSKGKYFVFDYHPIYDRKNDVWFYDTIYPNGKPMSKVYGTQVEPSSFATHLQDLTENDKPVII